MDVIPYIFFGVLTTLTNIIAYWICAYVCEFSVVLSTVLAWFIAVTFAYVTNRKYVFHSNKFRAREIIREMILMYACRLGTGMLDLLIMYVFVELLSFNDVLMKAIADILVIITNYIASKFLIFRKKTND